MRCARLLGRVGAGAALVSIAFGVQFALTAPPSAPSAVITIDPVRLLDTRNATGVPGVVPVAGGTSISLQVTGVGGVPTNATGVIITLTGTAATSATFVTATPTGTPRSTTSVLNVTPGQDIANTLTMSLGTGGKIELFNNAGTVHLVADVTGYLVPQNSPQLETATIQLAAFDAVRLSGTVGGHTSLGCVDLGGQNLSGEVALDIPLPDGAAIQSVNVRYYDTAAQEMTFLLVEVDGAFSTASPPNVSGTLTNGQAASNISTGYGNVTITPGGADASSPTVRYHLVAFTLGHALGGAEHWFCGVSVTYQRIVT